MALLSSAEKDFVRAGVAEGVRPDGRECLESRGFSVQVRLDPEDRERKGERARAREKESETES